MSSSFWEGFWATPPFSRHLSCPSGHLCSRHYSLYPSLTPQWQKPHQPREGKTPPDAFLRRGNRCSWPLELGKFLSSILLLFSLPHLVVLIITLDACKNMPHMPLHMLQRTRWSVILPISHPHQSTWLLTEH